MLIWIRSLGFLLSCLPERFLRFLCDGIGDAIYFLIPSRRRLILGNLYTVYSGKTEAWRRRLARVSCRRTVEMGMIVLISPFWTKKYYGRKITMAPKERTLFEKQMEKASVLLVPHFSLMEMITAVPLIANVPAEAGVIYRPFGRGALEKWVKRTRGRFGLKMLSRKEGFWGAQEILRKGGVVAVLFDQNAGFKGFLTTFCGKLASSTELPGLLAEKFGANVGFLYTRRRGFLRAQICFEKLEVEKKADAVMFASQAWLEEKLLSSKNISENWLWLHSRWRTQDEPHFRLRIRVKKDRLAETLAFLKKPELERKTRIWVRMPNWLGDVVMAIPLIRAIERGRPDAEVTLMVREHFVPLLKQLNVGHAYAPLPSNKGFRGFFKILREYRKRYPEVCILLTNSFRGDLEAKCMGAPQRFGIFRPGKWRPFLTYGLRLPKNFDESTIHQTELWRQFFEKCGLQESLDFTSPAVHASKKGPIGCICSTENFSEKRWPIEHWQTIFEKSPDKEFVLFGTERDRDICKVVAADFKNVQNLAGKTSLVEFSKLLGKCHCLITNDTGGMHLANFLNVPIIALFGPTSLKRTGPIFNPDHVKILQSHDKKMASISPEKVIKNL